MLGLVYCKHSICLDVTTEEWVLQWLRNWAISYGGNFLGALALVGLVAASGAFNEAAAAGPCAIAEYKCHHTWLQVCVSPAGS